MKQRAVPGEQLLQVAGHLVARKRTRQAALVYVTAGTASSSGLAPKSKAGALLEGARLLLRDGSSEALGHARSALLKACLILDGCSGCAQSRLHAGAMLETVCAREGERAQSVFNECYKVLQTRKSEVKTAWDWWIYFKGREISAAIREATAPSVDAITAASRSDAALRLIEDGIRQCEVHRDPLAAVAFSLIIVQLCLGTFTRTEGSDSQDSSRLVSLGIRDHNNACAENALQYARNTLSTIDARDYHAGDLSLLHLCSLTMESVLLLRSNRIKEAQSLGYSLMCAFDSAAQASRNASASGQWKWQNGKVLRSLVHYILAAGTASVSDNGGKMRYCLGALQWAGLDSSGNTEFLMSASPFQGKLEPFVANTISVMLLEGTARAKLARLQLVDAAPFVAGALARVQSSVPSLSLATQAAAYLLAAEYYMLLGSVESGEVAAQYLCRVIDTASQSKASAAELCDVLEMARTYVSLLTGEKRVTQGENAPWKGTNLSLAAALFAEGVYELRQINTIDAQNYLRRAISLTDDSSSTSNEQLATNARVTLASLLLSHMSIDHTTNELVDHSVTYAENSKDIVTLVRAARIKCKLLSRFSRDTNDAEMQAELTLKALERDLHEVQDAAPAILPR